MIEVKVPNIGDFKDVEVIELLVKVGDTVKVDQSLATVESDKASMEIPSTHAGVIKELKIKVGDKVNEGSPLMVVEEAAGAAAPDAGWPGATAAPCGAAPPCGVTAPGGSAAEGCSASVAVPPGGVSLMVGAVGRRSDSIFSLSRSRPARYSAPTKPSSRLDR